MKQSNALNQSQILKATLMVLMGFLAGGVLGIIRIFVISNAFGTSEALEIFYAAQRIPELIFTLIAGGALGSSFIPIYAKVRENNDQEAWRLASAVMSLVSLAALILGLFISVFAPQIVHLILLPGRSAEAQAITVDMIRIMMVTPFIFSISGLIMGILQSHGLFFLPAIAISMNSIGIIIGTLMIAPLLPEGSPLVMVNDLNVYGLAIGAVLSALLHLIVQLPGLFQIKAKLVFLPNWRIDGVIDVLKLMGPRVLGIAVVQINFLVNVNLSSDMVEGSFVALNTAFMLMFFVLGIIGQSLSSAVFPTLAALVAEKDMKAYKLRLAQAMRAVIFLALPATVFLILAGEHIVAFFERGEWTAQDTQATAWALSLYAIGIIGFSLLEVLSRAFYALSDTWTPVLIGIAAMISNIILSLILIQWIGDPQQLVGGAFGGLALANSLTTLIEAAILWALLRRKMGQFDVPADLQDSYILMGLVKTGIASLIMGIAIYISLSILPAQFRGLSDLVICSLIGGSAFFLSAYLLGLPEARTIPKRIFKRG